MPDGPDPAGAAERPGTNPTASDPSGPDPSGPDPTASDPSGPDPTASDPAGAGAHGRAEPERRAGIFTGGLRLAVTTLTVLPMRTTRVDRAVAAVAMSVAPLVGALLGAVLAGVLLGLTAVGVPALVAAGITVGASALLTRGLHLDGLADTVDALGSYRSGSAALEIMKKPDIGPFGVAAIALVLLIQTGALAASTDRGPVLVAAFAVGRLAVGLACRRGIPAARQQGLGALVAGTVPAVVVLAAGVLIAAGSIWAVSGQPWLGPLAAAAAVAAVLLLLRHAVRRFGGITGDVIGAAVEVATTVALVVLTIRVATPAG